MTNKIRALVCAILLVTACFLVPCKALGDTLSLRTPKTYSLQADTPPPSEWSYNLAFDKSGSAAVIGRKIGVIRNFLHQKGLNPEGWGLLGATVSDQPEFTYGGAFVFPINVADNATLNLGLTGRIAGDKPIRLGLLIGVSAKF